MATNYNDLLTQGAQNAVQIAGEYDRLWNDVLNINNNSPNLYGAMCEVGTIFAVSTLIILIFRMYSEVQNGNTASLVQLIMPLIVGLLLINNGSQLATITLEMREIINNINNQVLTSTITGEDLNESFAFANMLGAVSDELSKLYRACSSLSGEEASNCFDEAQRQGRSLLVAVDTAFPSMTTAWLVGISDALNSLGSNSQSIDSSTIRSNFFSPIVVPIWQSILFSILLSMNRGYQHILELALIMTALLGPIAIGGSLLPTGMANTGFAWLTSFFSLAIGKLSFNIILGLIAVIINSQGATMDNLWFPTVLGLFAPLLASALAAGGGIAIWQALVTGAQQAAGALRYALDLIPFY